jgi:hypothetical protein
MFEDDFTNGLDPAIWEHEINLAGGGNWEFQFYTHNKTNRYLKQHNLHLIQHTYFSWYHVFTVTLVMVFCT